MARHIEWKMKSSSSTTEEMSTTPAPDDCYWWCSLSLYFYDDLKEKNHVGKWRQMFIYFLQCMYINIFVCVSGVVRIPIEAERQKGRQHQIYVERLASVKGTLETFESVTGELSPALFFFLLFIPRRPVFLSTTAIGWKGSIKESVCVCMYVPGAVCVDAIAGPPLVRWTIFFFFRFLDAVDMVVIVGPVNWWLIHIPSQWRLLNNRRAAPRRRWWQVSHLYFLSSLWVSSSFYL